MHAFPSGIQRVAHRGMPRLAPENTLAGFLLALDAGADAIELDVHCTADGVVVVHHDAALNGVEIAGHPWGALQTLSAAAAAPMPRLAEVLEAVGDRAEVYVEIKGTGIEAAVIAVGRALGRRWAIHSFDHQTIERARMSAPDIPRGVLIDRDVADAPATLTAAVRRTGARDVWPHWSLVDDALLRAARDVNARLIPWTVNAPDVIARMTQSRVAGICTDDVRLLADR